MMKYALLLSTALVASSTAWAAGHAPKHMPKGVTTVADKHGALMAITTNHGKGTMKVAPPFNMASGQWSLVSKEPLAPYLPYTGYYTGCFGGGSFCFRQAEQFTASSTANSKSVTLGLSALSTYYYTYQANVSIYSDVGGLPGAPLGTSPKTVTAANNFFGGCCALTTAKIKAPLTSGTPYWIVVEAANPTDLNIWLLQDKDEVTYQNRAYDSGSGWVGYSTNWNSVAASVK
ncbi:MAG: hypothetical protein JO056_01360 [Alphaproteobacteria bacterium]|nr:hypothetical protein [Alphaproteobacteria bacterium]